MHCCGQGRAPFVHKILCARRRGGMRRARQRRRGRKARRGSRWRTEPLSLRNGQTTGGDRRRRQRTARQAETASGRDSGDARARAPRVTGPRRRRGHESAPPVPRYNFRSCDPEGGSTTGEGAPFRRARRGRASPREMNNPALPHATADAAVIGQASARRQAAGAPEGRKGHAPARHADARESAASGQADQTDDGETASGRGSTSTPRPAAARPRTRTAERRRDGRRRRRPGGTRTQEQAAYSLPPAQKNATQGRASRERGAAARRPPTAFRCRRSGWADGVSLPSFPRFMACGEQLSPFCRKNAQKGEKRKKGLSLCMSL